MFDNMIYVILGIKTPKYENKISQISVSACRLLQTIN